MLQAEEARILVWLKYYWLKMFLFNTITSLCRLPLRFGNSEKIVTEIILKNLRRK